MLRAAECRELTALFARDDVFRKRVSMGRHRFGEGDYGYFREPLPAIVSELRESLYARLAPIASRWSADLGQPGRFPATLSGWRRRCARAGQPHPTPLLLRYTEGGYNRLHQDLYGELSFPFQATVLLNRPDRDFSGGAFLLVENRPRQQSIGTAIPLECGEAVIFPVTERPVPGARGLLRATIRHGMSRLDGGERYALGIIFHDAK
ncbi:MAG: 2OG-Fe(II) oxygenase [Myxococcales bacterium]|nr:2OG-Fe(II) oxygenase [Myxococcales bacterium]